MVSKEFLLLLDETLDTHYYGFAENSGIDNFLLVEVESEWNWLKVYWKNYDRLAPDERLNCIESCLRYLASAAYELQSRITGIAFENIISAAKELHYKKNAGYSGSAEGEQLAKLKSLFANVWKDEDAFRNFRVCTEFNISVTDGCLVRLCDKFARFWSIYLNPENEKVGEDTAEVLRDFSAYCLILIVLLREE